MALSQACIEQHNRENAIARRWLWWGLVCASGFHVALVPLLALRSHPVKSLDELERIELLVTTSHESSSPIAQATQENKPDLEPETSPPPSSGKLKKTEELEPPEEPEESEKLEKAEEPGEPEKTEEPEELEAPEAPEEEAPEAAAPEEPEEEAPEKTNHQPNSSPEEPKVVDNPGSRQATQQATTNGSDIPEHSEPTRVFAPSLEPSIAVISSNDTESNTETDNQGAIAAGTEEIGTGGQSEDQTVARTTASQGSNEPPATSRDSTRFGCRDCVVPNYPEAASGDHVEGQPDIEFEVDKDGNVINARIAQSSGSTALDQAALDAVRRSSFTAGGQGRTHTIQMNFSIEGSERHRAAQRQGERRMIEELAPIQESESVIAQPESPTPGVDTSSSMPILDATGPESTETDDASSDIPQLTDSSSVSAEDADQINLSPSGEHSDSTAEISPDARQPANTNVISPEPMGASETLPETSTAPVNAPQIPNLPALSPSIPSTSTSPSAKPTEPAPQQPVLQLAPQPSSPQSVLQPVPHSPVLQQPDLQPIPDAKPLSGESETEN